MKALQIAWKDTLTRFRDWKALVGMIAAPLLISALVGLAFGNLGGESPISGIKVILVNQDTGELGQVYEEVFLSQELDDLLDVTQMDDLDEAKAQIESGAAREVVYIPEDFSASLQSRMVPGAAAEPGVVTILTDPTANVSPFIIQSIAEQVTAGINTVILAGEVSVNEALAYADVLGPRLAQLGGILTERLGPENFNFEEPLLDLQVVELGEADAGFSPYAYFVPGMAIFFLMFTMFDSSRSILQEETSGTLPRLLSTPTSLGEVVLGKMGGTFFTGFLQFAILVIASAYLFGLNWGSSIPGLIMISVLTVFAASSLGAFVTAFARNSNQAGIIGAAIAMIFGALGGTFFPAQNFSGVLNTLSKFTLNRWAMDGFIKLTIGNAGFTDLLTEAAVLAGIGIVTFGLARILFQRRFVR